MKIYLDVYLDNNLGDDLMISILADMFKEHEFFISSSNTLLNVSFKNYKNVNFISSISEKTFLSDLNVYITLGGSVFQIKGFLNKLHRIKKILYLISLKFRKIKIATIGCNIGPLQGLTGILIAVFELKLNNLVTVRDKTSYEFLKKWGINNSFYGQDIVYNLDTSKLVTKVQRHGLGISAYRSIVQPNINLPAYIKLAEIADEYIKIYGENVYLFAFDTETENDLSAAQNIKLRSKYPDKIFIVPYLGNSDEVIVEINRRRHFIAIRFHSIILCNILSIPMIPISYSLKTENMLKDINFNNSIKTLQKIDELDSHDLIVNFQNYSFEYSNTDRDLGYQIHLNMLYRFLEIDINSDQTASLN